MSRCHASTASAARLLCAALSGPQPVHDVVGFGCERDPHACGSLL